MKRPILVFVLFFWVLSFLGCQRISRKPELVRKTMVPRSINSNGNRIELPESKKRGEISLEEAIQRRRSRRDFIERPLDLKQLSQILWAAQGVTEESKGTRLRSAPSAGALYPLEIYLVVKDKGVEGLEAGVYHYLPHEHVIEFHLREDIKEAFVSACLEQGACREAPISLVITAEYERITSKYGERGKRYVHMEAGHTGQNVYLEVETLSLGTIVIGAFIDEKISEVLDLPKEYKPLYIMPVGWPE